MAVIYDRVRFQTATAGTGTIAIGSAAPGFRTLAGAGATNGDVVPYVIEEGSNWEIGWGTYSTASGGQLARTQVLSSSNANAAITLAGNAYVMIDAVAAHLNINAAAVLAAVDTGLA